MAKYLNLPMQRSAAEHRVKGKSSGNHGSAAEFRELILQGTKGGYGRAEE